MNKSAIAIALLSSSLLLVQVVFAEDATSTGTTRKQTIQQKVDTKQQNVQDKQSLRSDDLKQSLRDESLRIAAIREKIASKEAAMKARLEAFKDKRKAQITDRVNTNLAKINQNQTDQMLKHLARMSSILGKLEARVNEGKPDIKNPTAAKQAIADAKASIASATAAVKTQSEKDYTIQITSESKAKVDAQTQREQLHKDLTTVRKQVIDAKQKVSDAIRIAKGGPKTATPSAGVKEGTNGQK